MGQLDENSRKLDQKTRFFKIDFFQLKKILEKNLRKLKMGEIVRRKPYVVTSDWCT